MFNGSLVALATPMARDGSIDYAALSGLVEFQIDAGTSGVVVGGTTGESAALDTGELESLIVAAREVANGRVPVLAGTGRSATRDAVELTRKACAAGADGCLVVTPAYVKPAQAGLLGHFAAVADASSRPLILYNVPARTGCDLAPETVAALAEHEQIVGVKEAVPGPGRAARLRSLCGDGFTILSGDDATALAVMLAGGDGVVSVTANCAPAAMAALCRAALAGDVAGAAAIDARLSALHAALFLEPNPIAVKWALKRMGRIDDGIRLPLTPLAESFHPRVEAALAAAGVELPDH